MAKFVTLALFVFVILFSLFGAIGYKSNCLTAKPINQFEFEQSVIMKSKIGNSYYLMNIVVVFIGFPFKFFLGKEFLFIFLDEAFNKSLSTKID